MQVCTTHRWNPVEIAKSLSLQELKTTAKLLSIHVPHNLKNTEVYVEKIIKKLRSTLEVEKVLEADFHFSFNTKG